MGEWERDYATCGVDVVIDAQSITLYDNAKRAVTELLSVDEVCDSLDKSAAVQEYARRSKDKELEVRAAEYRVYCERRLGEFSAAAAANGHTGGRPRVGETSQEPCEVSRSGVADKAGVAESTLRAKHEPLAAASDDEFEEAVETCKADGEVPSAAKVRANLNSTKGAGNEGADQWNTPDRIIERVVAVMGAIDLDPCSDAGRNVPAGAHYTLADDGLAQPWYGRVFMNPPYSEARAWSRKLFEEVGAKHVSEFISLVPARPGSEWWRMYSEHDCLLCLVNGRIKFKGAPSGAPYPSAVFYLGENEEKFEALFGEVGHLWARVI